MKLKNKKTGEIIERYIIETASAIGAALILQDNDTSKHYQYNSLAELNEEWEDYRKEYWHITWCGDVVKETDDGTSADKDCKVIGNYFETKEEAEKAVEKLKAWKRLKDKGFRFTGYTHKDRGRLDELEIYCQLGECPENIEEMDDVHLLFGGEDE